jgi:hypothetical protein
MRHPEDDVLHVAPEPAEIVKLDQCLPARVLSARSSRKHGQQIAHLVRDLLLIRCWSRDQLRFQRVLRGAQRLFIGRDLCQKATKVSGLLRGHSAMLVEFDRFICHGGASRSNAA